MNIAFYECKEEEKCFFESHLQTHTLYFFEGTLQDELTQSKTYDIVSVFVHSRVSNALLINYPTFVTYRQDLQGLSTSSVHNFTKGVSKQVTLQGMQDLRYRSLPFHSYLMPHEKQTSHWRELNNTIHTILT